MVAKIKSSITSQGNTAPWNYIYYAILTIVAAVSIYRMVDAVLSGSKLQYADYWRTIEHLLLPDGSIDMAGIFLFSNQHLIAIPQLLYWLNIKLFSGSNIALGLLVVAIVCSTAAVLYLMIRRSRIGHTLQLALLTMVVALLFGMAGAWNFIYAMSGAAWLTANFFVVLAVYLRSRDLTVAAFLTAILATLSYGTGILVWPAICAAGALRRPYQSWWREWPYVAGFGISAFVVLVLGTSIYDPGTKHYALAISLAATFLGNTLGLAGITADIAGWTVLTATPLLGLWLTLFSRRREDAGWVGVALYGWSAVLMIAYGRALFIVAHGFAGRYYSIGALTWLGFTVLLTLTLRNLAGYFVTQNRDAKEDTRMAVASGMGKLNTLTPYLLIALVTLAGLRLDTSEVTKRDNRLAHQQLNEIALQLDIVDGSVGYLEGYTNNEKHFSSTQSLKNAGHYPFVSDWNLDCGLLGTVLPKPTEMRKGGNIHGVKPEIRLDSVERITGTMPAKSIIEGDVRCIVVVDITATVIGIGVVRPGQYSESSQRFTALARKTNGDMVVYVYDKSDSPIVLESL